MPGLAEAKGLLALMLFHRARQAARVDTKGDLVRLEDQDRSLWDMAAVEEGKRHLAAARHQGEVGPYQLQAAIAGCHVSAPTAETTDPAQIMCGNFRTRWLPIMTPCQTSRRGALLP
jgi:RNA polymerase sigma-70 factor (ECF subfamily)